MNPTHQLLISWCLQTAETREVAADLLAAAERHRVIGLLLSRIDRSVGISGLPEPERNLADPAFRKLRLRSSLMELEWDRILHSLNDAGIVPIGLKGIVLADCYYQEPIERQLRDIDLMIPRSRLKSTIRCLTQMGYRCVHGASGSRGYVRHHFHVQLFHPNGFTVEVHWDVTRRSDYFHLDPLEIRRRSVERRRGSGAVFLMPAAHHMILTIVLQNLQEGFSRLCRTVDIDRLIRGSHDLNWSELMDQAKSGQLLAPLALSLQLCRRTLVTPLPHDWQDRLELGRSVRYHLSLFRPVEFLMNQEAVRRASAARLLQHRLAPSRKQRNASMRKLLADPKDPLQSLWIEPTKADGDNSLGKRLRILLSLLGHQAFLYVRGFLGTLLRTEDQVRFWS